METTKKEKGFCDKCPHCQKLAIDRRFRQFNRENKPFADIDLYHQMLFIEGEARDCGLCQFDSVEDFITACEKIVKKEKVEMKKWDSEVEQ